MKIGRGRFHDRAALLTRFGAGYAAAVVLVLGGCSGPTGAAPGRPAAPAKSRDAAGPSDKAEPAIRILSWDQTQKLREGFQGKVVVLDVWSTFCEPCVREFPNLVALQERFGEKIACISFNTDYSGAKSEPPETFRKAVAAFLASRKARLVNVISSDPNEEFYDRIRLGGPPAVLVYDRSGKLVQRFDNSRVPKTPEFTYKNSVVPLVEKLLAGRD